MQNFCDQSQNFCGQVYAIKVEVSVIKVKIPMIKVKIFVIKFEVSVINVNVSVIKHQSAPSSVWYKLCHTLKFIRKLFSQSNCLILVRGWAKSYTMKTHLWNWKSTLKPIELKRTGTLPHLQSPMIGWSRVSGGISRVTRVFVGKPESATFALVLLNDNFRSVSARF